VNSSPDNSSQEQFYPNKQFFLGSFIEKSSLIYIVKELSSGKIDQGRIDLGKNCSWDELSGEELIREALIVI
jgi:hypothetical protein